MKIETEGGMLKTLTQILMLYKEKLLLLVK